MRWSEETRRWTFIPALFLAAGMVLHAPARLLAAGVVLHAPPRLLAAGMAQPSSGPGSLKTEETADRASEAFPASIPARYNLAELGKKPKVRSQGNTGTCWAISSVSAIESDLLPQKEILLSADHMSLCNGFSATQDDGGDYYMIMSYLSDWKGPVLEEEDPYGDGVSPEDLSAAVHVQEIRMIKNMPSADYVKRVILKYGAVQSSLCLDRLRTDTDGFHYYNALTSAYFDPVTENLDHDILILGWDDSFSRDNFRIKPPGDGAWICQNTWGESFGENGIFYVSYKDRNLLRGGGLTYARIEDTDNYDHVYENDSLGWQGRQGFDGQECWFAGAFTAEGKEELAAVGLYSVGPGTTCEVYVIPHFEGEQDLENLPGQFSGPEADKTEDADPETGESELMPEPAARMSMDMAGYFTIDLEEKIPLEPGQQFAVAVRIETEGETKPVAVEMVKDPYTADVTLEGRQTWVSPDGKNWENTQLGYMTNVCLKAYTGEYHEENDHSSDRK